MKSILLTALLWLSPTYIVASERDILREIKNLREDMNRRFEQVDKRFEQIDKRFEFIQALIIALLTLTVGSPLAQEYFARKRAAHAEKIADDLRKVIHALREVAEKDPRVGKALRHAGLL